MFGITRIPAEHRGLGVKWLVTLSSGEKSGVGDLPSAIILRIIWRAWSTSWRQ